MESACASQAANMDKKEHEMKASLPVLGSGRKNVEMKETGHSFLNSVNKFASQIRKPSHRRGSSPINWFPRKKTDSFLKRKIRLLQEGGGMSLSLVETLGNANPHYTRIAREKIAAQEAASKAMKARKAAMVEASWCRILQAASIQNKDAESKLENAEQHAEEAFEEAKLMGVMMFDRPDCPRISCEIQSSSAATGGKSSHTVTASFESEFDVDREVAAAVRKAFIILVNCSSSSNKEEFRDLLRKIRQNPEDYEAAQESMTASPKQNATLVSTEISEKRNDMSHRKSNCGILTDCQEDNGSSSFEDLVNIMVDRLKELQEDELSSLATIVATCGLNAALVEMQIIKDHDNSVDARGLQRRSNINQSSCASKKKKEDITNVPSLDKFLVKHVSKLEREVQETQISKKINVSKEFHKNVSDYRPLQLRQITKTSQATSDFGSILIKHVSKFEKEIQEAKNSQKQTLEAFSCQNGRGTNDFEQSSLDEILVKPVGWLEIEKTEDMEKGNVSSVKKMDRQLEKIDSLDVILVKRQSKLEKAKLVAVQEGTDFVMQKRGQHVDNLASLDEILVKRPSKIDRVKLEATQNSENSIKHVDARREARERELQEAWGGLSLGNSLRPHLSKLEKDKAAWRRAEEEEKIHRREC